LAWRLDLVGKMLVLVRADGTLMRRIRVEDAATGQTVLLGGGTSALAFATGVHFAPDGRYLYAECSEKSFAGWDMRTGKRIGSDLPPGVPWHELTFSSDGRFILWKGRDKAWIIDARTGKRLRRLREYPPGNGTAISPDGRRACTPFQGL